MKAKLYFEPSKRHATRLTELFDFVWPTAVAMWNLRSQVSEFIAHNANATEPELLARFVAGSGIVGANLRHACMELSWTNQQAEFARFLLFEICAIYETWCEQILFELGRPPRLSKHLQFPTHPTRNEGGVSYAIRTINTVTSPALTAAIYPTLISNSKNSLAYLEQLLLCYRYFKEIRNSFIHGSNIASTSFVDAQMRYASLTKASLGVKEIPEWTQHVAGQPIPLSLRGVVGFGDIVLRLICTLDIEFAKSAYAEGVFERRWKVIHGPKPVMLAADANKKVRRVQRLVRAMGLPRPKASPAFVKWLSTRRRKRPVTAVDPQSALIRRRELERI